MAAGYLVGQVEGFEWETLVQARIFDTLGMASTYPSFQTASGAPHRATPMNWNGTAASVVPGGWERNYIFGASAPAGAINSNVLDMLK